MEKCYIVEDLLPLYNDGLLQEETKNWLEGHLASCDTCKELHRLSTKPIQSEQIEADVDYEKMIQRNNLKISLYQFLFVGISFFLATRSMILMEDFSFVLYYTILGFVTYLFYKRYLIVLLISFMPIFLYQLASFLMKIKLLIQTLDTSLGRILWNFLFGSVISGGISLLFAVLGASIGLFTLKLFEGEDASD